MPIPTYEDLMLPVLELLGDGRPRHLSEIRDSLAPRMGVAAADRKETLGSGELKYDNRVGWARKYLMEARLIERVDKGVYQITGRGLEVLSSRPGTVDRQYLMQFPEFRKFVDR